MFGSINLSVCWPARTGIGPPLTTIQFKPRELEVREILHPLRALAVPIPSKKTRKHGINECIGKKNTTWHVCLERYSINNVFSEYIHIWSSKSFCVQLTHKLHPHKHAGTTGYGRRGSLLFSIPWNPSILKVYVYFKVTRLVYPLVNQSNLQIRALYHQGSVKEVGLFA